MTNPITKEDVEAIIKAHTPSDKEIKKLTEALASLLIFIIVGSILLTTGILLLIHKLAYKLAELL